jgi:hypothetical protein
MAIYKGSCVQALIGGTYLVSAADNTSVMLEAISYAAAAVSVNVVPAISAHMINSFMVIPSLV